MSELEGTLDALGEEIALLQGWRSTRVTTSVNAATRLSRGSYTASSADGLTVTLSAGSFDSASPAENVAAGMRLRMTSDALTNSLQSGTGDGFVELDPLARDGRGRYFNVPAGLSADVHPGCRVLVTSGSLSGESALIARIVPPAAGSGDATLYRCELMAPYFSSAAGAVDWDICTDHTNCDFEIVTRNSSTSIELRTPGTLAAFTSQSWEIYHAATTSVDVESTLDWAASGRVGLGGAVYDYGSLTATTLDELAPAAHHPRFSTFTVLGGADLVEGEQLVLRNGHGCTVTLEFYENAAWPHTGGTIPISFVDSTGVDDSAAEVAAKIIAALNAHPEFSRTTQAYSRATGVIGLWSRAEGGLGWFDVRDSVTDVDFKVTGPRGADHEIGTLSEVVDLSLVYSGHDQYRASWLLEHATSTALDDIGAVLGIPRILGLDDARYRDLLHRSAYDTRHTRQGLHNALEALYGRGRFDVFDDLTFGSVRHGGQTFVAKYTDTSDLRYKALIEDSHVALMASATTATLESVPNEPEVIGSVRLAADPSRLHLGMDEVERGVAPGRLIAQGTGANYDVSTARVTLDTGAFSTDILKGDTFEFISGRARGQRGTVLSVDGGGAYVELAATAIGMVRYAANYTISETVDFGLARWRVWREKSLFAYYVPTADKWIDQPGAAAAARWAAAAGGGSSLAISSTGPDVNFLQLDDTDTVKTTTHSLDARIDADSLVSFTCCMNIYQCLGGNTALDRHQFVMRASRYNGATSHSACIGIGQSSNDRYIGFVDNAGAFTGSFYTLTGISATTVANAWQTLELRVDFARTVGSYVWAEIWVGGVLRIAEYTAWGGLTTSALLFGSLANSGGANFQCVNEIRWVNWNIQQRRDYANNYTTASVSSPNVCTAADPIFAAADDDTGPRRYVRLYANAEDLAYNASLGTAAGLWEVETYSSTTVVTLRGLTHGGGIFSENLSGNAVFEAAEADAFTWPDSLGHEVEILNGPNAGTYQILNILARDEDGELYAISDRLSIAADLAIASPATVPPRQQSALVHLYNAPIPISPTPVSWRIIPDFPTDTLNCIRVVAATSAAGVVTFTEPVHSSVAGGASGALMDVEAAYARSLYMDNLSAKDVLADGDACSSLDGLVVTVNTGALTGIDVGEGDTITVRGSNLAVSTPTARIESVSGDDVTLTAPGFTEAFSGASWVIVRPAIMDTDSGGQTRAGGYIADEFGYWTRQFLASFACAGHQIDFDSLIRTAANDDIYDVTGLILKD